jgi:tetratricopeptide (TPR) repeat protein
VPEEVEQLVFRALHKDPAIRYQNGRELARALRQARGQTVPMDLRSEVLPPPAAPAARPPRTPRRLWWGAAAALLVPVLVAAWWLLRPPPRTVVLVAPVANQTGFAELDPYRLGFTQALIARLADARDIRPVAYAQMLPALRPFIDEQGGVSRISSPEAIRALAAQAGASIVVVPTLLYENGEWRGRVEFRDAHTMTGAALPAYESESRLSALPPVIGYQLVAALADGVSGRFKSAPSRARDWIAAPIQAEGGLPGIFLQSHDAVRELERGARAYDALELRAAADAFAAAERQDPNHPLPAAWRSRVALLMGERQAALDAASRALDRVGPRTRSVDRMFTEAVAFEARGETEPADRRYRALVSESSGDPVWVAERAAFLDRQGRVDDAVTLYHEALAADATFIRPRLELCALYGPSRKQQPELAARFGEQARAMYERISDRMGAAQARLCLSQTLQGSDTTREEARRQVDEALAVFEAQGATYNLARALHYAALVRGRGDLPAAVTFWERSLAAAGQVSNTSLQASVSSNLGVAHESLGNFAQALQYYEQSYRVSEARHDERRAAYNQANAGALRIWNGIDPGQGLRDVQNALAVVRRLNDKNFEVLCLQMIAAYHRFSGAHADAENGLRVALAIAMELGDADAVESLTVDRGRLFEDAGRYTDALAALSPVADDAKSSRRLEARVLVGRLHAALGDFAAAARVLEQTAAEIDAAPGRGLKPELHATLGRVAYEQRRVREAQSEFQRAAALWDDEFPHPASVEASAYLGLLEAEAGRASAGRERAERSVAQSARMGMVTLNARCRILLARIALLSRRPDNAVAVLSDLTTSHVGAELQASIHGTRAEAFMALGDADAVSLERRAAKLAIEQLLDKAPGDYRSRIAARPTIMSVLQN